MKFKGPLRILMLEDVAADALLIEHELRRANVSFTSRCVDTPEAFEAALADFSPDIILSDFSLPQFNALHALQLIQKRGSELPFILVTGSQSEEVAVACIKEGADDYILKSSLKRLPSAVLSALKSREAVRERLSAQQTLRQREEHFRALIENATDIITILGSDGCILYESPSLERVLGYVPAELIGSNSFHLVHPDDLPHVLSAFHELLAEPSGTRSIEYRFRHKSGDWRVLETIATNLLNAPDVHGIVANSRDVTERTEAEDRIRDQAALLDKAQDAIWVEDTEGRITFWNSSATRLYGWNAQEALGHRTDELLRQPERSVSDSRAEALQKGEWHGELQHLTKAGKVVTVESRWSLVCSADAKPKAILVINTDITDKKNLEAQFLRIQRMESIGVLAGGIAHDLNNVLTPASVAIRMLREEIQSPIGQEILATLETSIRRGSGIVQQVLSFARGVEGERTVLHLKHPLAEVVAIVKETFPRSITVSFRIPKELWLISGDATQLHQVFMNLCVNARDALPKGGRIQVEAENVLIDENYARMQPEAKAGPYVVISCSDTGTGIAPEVVGHIFEPFFTTKAVGKGTGLGLSTVLGIVKSHGGFINVYSEIGKGTRFKVYLPAVTECECATPDAPMPEALLGRGEGVLVADDEAAIRDVIRITLEANGYRVYTASDGPEAVAVYAQERGRIDVVLVDVMMPYMDGPATIRALQRLDGEARFIAMSGLMDTEGTHAGFDEGQISFLTKPFSSEKLLAALRVVLDKRAQPA